MNTDSHELGKVTTHDNAVLLLRVEEAALRLGIARTSMFHLLASRQIESVRVGRLRRIPVACLEEYIERLRGEEQELSSQLALRERPPVGDV